MLKTPTTKVNFDYKTNSSVCKICGLVCPPFDPDIYRFVTPDGKKIAFCYQHLYEMVVKNDSFLPMVSKKIGLFDLQIFINETKQILAEKNPKYYKTKRTVKLMEEFLKKIEMNNH